MKFSGVVAKGQGLGRKLGFPTANLDVAGAEKLPRGVHKVRVDGRIAVCNVGVRPTVGGTTLVVEVHIPGFSGDLYGQTLEVEVLGKLRDEKKFASVEELKTQIAADVAAALKG
jgi:riboflavin kinase / FMN adenylyltransferase